MSAAILELFQEMVEAQFVNSVRKNVASVLDVTIAVRVFFVDQSLIIAVNRNLGAGSVLRRGDARCVNVRLRSVRRCLCRRHVKLVRMR